MCSMLSAQVDKLRERAKELRSLAPDPTVPYLVPSTKETMALAMRSAASEMEDAADTIWELRCKCAGMVDMRERARLAETENAKLREERREYQATIDSLVDECADHKAENAKLRELVDELWSLAYGYAPEESELDAARDMIRELGVEA